MNNRSVSVNNRFVNVNNRFVIVIPAYKPDERLLRLARALKEAGFQQIIVVNDGSGLEYETIFAALIYEGCRVIDHPVNRGKGAALRTGIRAAQAIVGQDVSVITADADGQHTPEDIAAVACAMRHYPDSLVLGTRDFSGADVPWKSRTGNRITAAFFRLTTGKKCRDTQTGLRGIPASLIPLALSEEGDRYEYEMNFLTDAVKTAPLYEVPIRTIYENNNEGSHFRPFADSARIYGRLLRFAAASLMSVLFDLGLFAAILHFLENAGAFSALSTSVFASSAFFTEILSKLGGDGGSLAAYVRIFSAVLMARIASGTFNFALNRHWSFKSRGRAAGEALRYLILFLAIMSASAAGTTLLSLVLPSAAAKILTDTLLFFVSYRIQKNWVFRRVQPLAHNNPSGFQENKAARETSREMLGQIYVHNKKQIQAN